MHRKRMREIFIVISQFHRRGGAWLRPPLPNPQTRKSTPRTISGPAVQAPTSKKQSLRKKISPFQNFIVGAGLGSARVCRTLAPAFRPAPTPNTPALAAPTTPKIYPRTVGGPAMQAPTSKRHGLRKKMSLFQNFIVGASIARPLKPCAAASPPGGAEPHPYHAPRESALKFYRYLAISP